MKTFYILFSGGGGTRAADEGVGAEFYRGHDHWQRWQLHQADQGGQWVLYTGVVEIKEV